EVVTLEESFPKGTYVVPTAQFLGRLVAHMLEPETPDNVVYWNTMDAWIPRPAVEGEGERPSVDPDDPPERTPPAGGPPAGGFGGQARAEQGPPVVPIYKLMTPTALPTRMLGEGR
ncbi:MAG: hypothetical protein MUO50_00465, partial [Longimicrobiales bacterium]|nr:hypothetical protein [Longimicrobiales bacterium]